MNQFGICMKVYNYNICISHKIVFDKRLEDTIVRYYLKGPGRKSLGRVHFGCVKYGFGKYSFEKYGFGKYGFGNMVSRNMVSRNMVSGKYDMYAIGRNTFKLESHLKPSIQGSTYILAKLLFPKNRTKSHINL